MSNPAFRERLYGELAVLGRRWARGELGASRGRARWHCVGMTLTLRGLLTAGPAAFGALAHSLMHVASLPVA